MSNVLTSFLVGVGVDFDEKGAKDVDTGLNNIKTRALQLGAVLAGAFGLKVLTSDFASAADKVGKFSEVFGVLPDDVRALGDAFELEGGTFDTFLSQIKQLEELRAGLLVGDADFISRAGIAGIDTGPIIAATNATEAYIALADQFATMTQDQRLNAASALGLDEASIRLLSKGTGEVRRLQEQMKTIRPMTKEMTEAAKEYNDATKILGNNIGSFADQISLTLLPPLTDVVDGMNDWIAANRELAGQNLETVLKPIAKYFDEIAVSGSLFATGGALMAFGAMAGFLPIIGGAVATMAGALSGVAIAAGAIYVAAQLWDVTPNQAEKATNGVMPDWWYDYMFTPWFTIGMPDNRNSFDGIGHGVTSPNGTSATAPIVPSQNFIIENVIKLDGKVIDRRINDVTGSHLNRSLDDIKSTNGG